MTQEATRLLQRLIACDTSNPPGREVQAVAVLEHYLLSGPRLQPDRQGPAATTCSHGFRVADDPRLSRPTPTWCRAQLSPRRAALPVAGTSRAPASDAQLHSPVF